MIFTITALIVVASFSACSAPFKRTGLPVPQPQMTGEVIAINASDRRSFAIMADNSLWGWGSNWSGQLGDGTTEDRHSPVKIIEDVISVSSSPLHTAAITSDGTLWTWGDNTSGQLGTGTNRGAFESQVTGSIVLSQHRSPVKIIENVESNSG